MSRNARSEEFPETFLPDVAEAADRALDEVLFEDKLIEAVGRRATLASRRLRRSS